MYVNDRKGDLGYRGRLDLFRKQTLPTMGPGSNVSEVGNVGLVDQSKPDGTAS